MSFQQILTMIRSGCLVDINGVVVSERIISTLFELNHEAIGNDLFRYKINNRLWTWVSGSSSYSVGTYGALNQESINNAPSARSLLTMEYHGLSSSLLLYGGRAVAS